MQCNIIEAIASVNNEKNLLWKSVARLSSKSKTDVMLVQCNAISSKQSQVLTIKKIFFVRAESVTQSRSNSHDRLMSRRFHGLVYFNPLNPKITENLNSQLMPLFISYRSSGEKLIKYQANSSCVIMSVILTGLRFIFEHFCPWKCDTWKIF